VEAAGVIRLEMSLVPFGDGRRPEHSVIRAHIETVKSETEAFHDFVFYDAKGAFLCSGRIPRPMSGHRNPLRLLKAIMAEIDVDVFAPDHNRTGWEDLHGL
jgi:hypothetical protein